MGEAVISVTELREQLESVVTETVCTTIRTATHSERMATVRYRLVVVLLIGFTIVFTGFIYTIGFFVTATWFIIISSAVGALGCLYKMSVYQKQYTKSLTEAIMPVLSEILACPVTLLEVPGQHESLTKLLSDSKLLTESVDSLRIDDSFTLGLDSLVMVHEIVATKQVQTGKTTTTVTVFKGFFAAMTLTKQYAGSTYISTEGDVVGFGNRTPSSIFAGTDVQETKLEWNEFEADLHVATTDPVAARMFLTPDIMVALHTWWGEHRKSIRLVVSGNQLYLLLPETMTKFWYVSTRVSKAGINAYALTLIRPLARIQRLAQLVPRI